MPVVPSIGGRSVNIQQIGSPSLSMNAPDASGLSQGLNRVENAVIDHVQKERENADTAALLDADRKLNDWKTATMFDPKSGVYTRKGQNALDITNQTLPGYDKHVEEVMGGLGNEQQKARFKIVAARQREALSGELNRYEYNERQTWYNESDEASKVGAATSASLYYNRPDQMAGYLNKGLAVIESQGQRNGWPAQKVDQEKQAFASGVHQTAIDRLISENPNEAITRYASVKDSMTQEDRDKVDSVLIPKLQIDQGAALARSALAGGFPSDADALAPVVMDIESGGNQFDKTGNPLTSSAGAIGSMQIMPATGPEAAKLAGLKWDENKLKTDAEYNICLGKAYLKKQCDTFGDGILALAAYNAGPGRVQATIKKIGDPRTGEVTYEQFIKALPAETQGYIAKAEKMLPVTEGAADRRTQLAAAQAAGLSLPPGKVRDSYESTIADATKAYTAQQDAMLEQAAAFLKDGGSYDTMPPEMQRNLDATTTSTLLTLEKKLKGKVPDETVPGRLDHYLNLPPDKLAALSVESVRADLSDADAKTVQSAILAARNGDRSVQGVAKAENDALNERMALAGIKLGTSQEALLPFNMKKQQQFKATYQRMRDAWVQANDGKQPSMAESQQLADQLLIKVKLDDEWGDRSIWQLTPEQRGQAYVEKDDIELDEMSLADREAAVADLKDRGITPTERTIKGAYVDLLTARGLRVK